MLIIRMHALKWIKCAVFFGVLSVSYGQVVKNNIPDQHDIVDTQTAIEKWEVVESRLKALIQNAIKILLPPAIESSQSLNISAPCIRDVLKVVSGLKRMKIWAFKFLDASSKSIDGYLDGTMAAFGNYDECIENQVFPERSQGREGKVLFRGKYCRVEVKPYLPPQPKKIYIYETIKALENFTNKDTITGALAKQAHLTYHGSITLGLCVPSGCSKDDVNQVLREVSDYAGLVIRSPRCETKEDANFTPLMIVIITIYSLTLLVVIIGSGVDLYGIHKDKKFKSTVIRILVSFSFISNFRKFSDTSTSSETLSCLNSIRTISITWIIHGHSLVAFTYTPHKTRKAFDLVEDLPFQCIMTSPLAVETFFFITGTLVCYNVTKLIQVGKKSLKVMMYLFHRIWRIYPAYIYTIGFIFLTPLMASGPEFHSVGDDLIKSCEKNWWTNILFINNFYDPENMCYPTSWYLTVDLQLHVCALMILLPLMRKPKLGITLAVITVTLSMVGSWLSIYWNDLMPKIGFSADPVLINRTFRNFYILPHAHAGPYCIGILCGYLLAMKPKIQIQKVIRIFGWSVATITSLSLTYGVPKWNGFVEPTFVETLLFSMFYRVGWAFCVGWVVVSCCTGNAGILNYVLSWKMWIPFGRLTYLAYLVHTLVIGLHTASTRTEVVVDFHTDVYNFLGSAVITYLCAFGGSMLVESPFLSLEKIIFPKARSNQQMSTDCEKNEETVHTPVYSENICIQVESSEKENAVRIHTGFHRTDVVCRL